MKNIVVMPNFKEPLDKPDPLFVTNSKILWNEWCKKNNHEFLSIETPIIDFRSICPQMQKIWVMDILDNSNIEYNLILMVDHDTYPTPECKDVFEISQGEFSAALDNGFGPQLNRLIRLFKDTWFKNNTKVNWDSYFNSGFIVYGKKHKDLFKKTQDFYFKYRSEFAVLNKADDLNDQTILNFIVSESDHKFNLLPRSFNVLDFHMERFLMNSYTDELGRYINREQNIMDCINVFHIGNGNIRDAASEYLKKEIWRLN